MPSSLHLYNTLTHRSEKFEPLSPPFVGMYLCGPTVYGDPHLGHSRGALTMDVLLRYLKHLNFKVRYVRNITDVGHLMNDADDGEDKIGKKAKLDNVEPMEVVQRYTNSYHNALKSINIIPPSIEPRASGHIIEQIEMIQEIMENGFAYEKNGSVYFDVIKYAETHDYGNLSGRKIEDLIAGAGENRRSLEGQSEKKNSNDFALWKKASPEHIMKWNSPWGRGFPGWHIECSAMSEKYLGKEFDIHAGGMDLLFPHHESEIAQSKACNHTNPAKYWLHNNMITVNGQKMAKSLDNGILIKELFSGNHRLLDQAYSPMTLRFFLLQAHYRSTLDFSNEALKAAEKGFQRLMNGVKSVEGLKSSLESDYDIAEWKDKLYGQLNDDLSTPQVIASLFEAVKWINEIAAGRSKIAKEDLKILKTTFKIFVFEILGFVHEKSSNNQTLDGIMDLVLEIRNTAKSNKDWETADKIRNQLNDLGIEIMDGKDGSSFKIN
ncbi:MAG: cysteine--tRNA ligase [Bacteroidia bacterium]|nr:cysteine--tRNA ligase [Bacteroidia bacterium]MDG2041802.1 cysteine--tRNA ligase [Bacteroidia bacterium]|tara:strand:- start:24325 stop:25800 length:1476 start_codon:yes stop_codon:yes gene_type:complete